MIAYLDCTSGISGDKFLAALLDAGQADGRFTLEYLRETIAALGLGEASVTTDTVTRGGIRGLHVHVEATHEPPHRHWKEIRALLETAPLPAGARERSLAAFQALAQAEARVHGVEPDTVHFHEVGATDSIVDIVGVSLGLESLEIDRLVCSPIALGSGTVSTSHGVLPVPAPATLELLAGVPVLAGAGTGELTTPTGAALVATNATAFGGMPALTVTRIGYGAGSREIQGLPNVARIALGHELAERTDTPVASDDTGHEQVVLLETTLDHLSPEQIAFAADEIRQSGALDVWQVPAAMKKGRLGIELRVLTTPEHARSTQQAIHDLTGSLGVRRQAMTRSVLEREVLAIEGPWGPFRVKVSGTGASRRIRPEHDDIARIAREHDATYAHTARELTRVARERLGETQ